MASDRRTSTAAAENTDLGNVLGEWLDPFAEDAATQGTEAAEASDEARGFEFSEWCVIPVAMLIVIGDMVVQFLRH
jgi:hypothetical protein